MSREWMCITLAEINQIYDFAEQSDIFNKTKLISPQKQYTYLAGLLMSTDDKSEGSIIDDVRKYDDLLV